MSLQTQQTGVGCALPREDALEPAAIQTMTSGMAEGKEDAYHAFYDAYFPRLSRYLLVVTGGNEEASHEALQATMVRVVRHIRIFPEEAAFWHWLTVVSRSALIDQSRKQRRYLSFLGRFTRYHQLQHAVPEEAGANIQMLASLEHGLATLPPDERELVERKYFALRSARQLAEELQTTEKAVESRLTRVRRKLKELVLNELKNESSR